MSGTRGIVAADHELASRAGVGIFAAGGSAIDVAVATAFAVCVVHPSSCGIGGGGFMLIYHAGSQSTFALDYRETAPAAAHRDMYVRDGQVVPELSRRGGLAVAVPGEVAGLTLVQQRFGSLPLATVMAPAIELARDGFPIGAHLAETIERNAEALRRSDGLRQVFLHPDGTPRRAGETLRQTDLARTLEEIATHGPSAFYRGTTAERIAAAVQASGGLLTAEDLAGYEPVWRQPLRMTFANADLIAMPPPSSAGVLLEVVGILGRDDLRGLGRESAEYSHLLAEAMKHGFADRARLYGDTEVPVDWLASDQNQRALRQRISAQRVLEPSEYGSGLDVTGTGIDDTGTSHLSVLDAAGNAVACTTTINTAFGAMVMARGTGVILNNEMDDFSAQPGVPNVYGLIGSEANAIAPGKRPLSSMSPTIAVRGGEAFLAVGGSGGPLILSGTIQVLLNALVFDLDAESAVSAPRLHHQWMPPVLAVEPGVAPAVRAALAERGHSVKEVATMGAIQLAQRRHRRLEGASDPRKGGEAVAW